VDGFKVSEELKKKNPNAFKFFSTFDFPHVFTTRNGETNLLNRTKLINVENESVYCFRYNNLDRTIIDLDPKNQELYYEYFPQLAEIVRSRENEIRFKLEPGMLLFTNNWRVTHGRESFIGQRTLIGCYLNEEDFLSKFSSLNKN
jgi:alpha-ketoglutarate-dependent taurine dioxygenase